MNQVLDAIKNRRSVRAYKPEPIPRDVLSTIIEAGNQAPSGGNLQPWRFVVVEDSEFKRKLRQAAFPTWKKVVEGWKDKRPESYRRIMKRYREMEEPKDPVYFNAPTILFVIGTSRNDCPVVCQNIMLAAHSLGIGSCWVGFGAQVTDDAEVVKALELKNGERIFGPILLGYPEDHPDPPKKKDPVIKWI